MSRAGRPRPASPRPRAPPRRRCAPTRPACTAATTPAARRPAAPARSRRVTTANASRGVRGHQSVGVVERGSRVARRPPRRDRRAPGSSTPPGRRPRPMASASRARLAATAAGSSPTWSPRLKVSNGGAETPPARVVVTRRMRTLTCPVSGARSRQSARRRPRPVCRASQQLSAQRRMKGGTSTSSSSPPMSRSHHWCAPTR